MKGLVWSILIATTLCTTQGVETVEIAKPVVMKSVYGVVQDAMGSAIAGADVKLFSKDGRELSSAKTDTRGNFELLRIANGEYDIKAMMPGFNPLLVHVVVR